MLTSDLVRTRRKGTMLRPVYLKEAAVERLLPVAEEYAETLAHMVGSSREEVEAALGAVEVPARDRATALGIRKVLEDRCEFETVEGVDPEALRRALFAASAAAHKGLGVREEFDRDAVIEAVAAELGTTAEAIEAGLYADLRGSEILKSVRRLSPAAAIERYNLALAQSILLRATRLTITIEGEEPGRLRQIFRAARFHELLHVVRRAPPSGFVLELDGPFSLFDSVQRYGLRLALFLPSVLPCLTFKLRADVLWGRERVPLTFELGPEDGLVGHGGAPVAPPVDLDVFRAAFERLGTAWTVEPNEQIFALPGEVVCVPDLVFQNRETGEEIYFEVFGFWSRDAVWKRIELIRKGFPARILLAVGKHLRVSEEVLAEEEMGELYVFKTALSPRAVLERIERLERGKPSRQG